ncbi:MBL fold metallo-hydrolase [Brevibacterium sp. 'Marine']|uniref:MBL fold metallo-hydrolase n=1 Tax=Brevibacterium sp. 'Marine' TaxID=2725563 RepID=UPI00145C68F4|nr:MBL fold metallo-hydrolase [Brevibacterium sp. 'Marine']
MRTLTVLGASAAHPVPGEACSGYFLDWDGFRLVLDLGYGTFPRLLSHVPDAEIDAVVITHEHPDHCIDLHALFRFRQYAETPTKKLPLYCPAGVIDRLGAVEPGLDMTSAFDIHLLPGHFEVGPLRLSSVSLPHFVPNYGVRLETATAAVAFTGDTGPHPGLADLGRAADLYIVDATDRPGEQDSTRRNLLTASEAGEWAQRAGAKRLLLTHFWPGNDRSASAEDAGEHFDGEVLTAEPDLRIAL